MRSKWILGFSLLWLCAACHNKHHRPEQGQLLLNDPELDLYEPHTLDGVWEFYPNQALEPEDFAAGVKAEPLLVSVPAMWANYQLDDGSNFQVEGYGTFRLVIHLGQPTDQLGLYIPRIWSANRVYANGQLISEHGQFATNAEQHRNKIIHQLTRLPSLEGQDEIELIVQVSNFNFFVGGLVESFWLGKYQHLKVESEIENTWTLMWIGCLILMGFYHIILYTYRKKNASVLYFGIICLLIAVRLIVFGEHYLYILLKDEWATLTDDIQVKTYYLATFLLAPLGLLYVRSLYPSVFKWLWPIRVSVITTGMYAVFALIAPLIVLTLTLQAFFALSVVPSMLLILYVLLAAAYRKLEESGLQVLGVLAVLLAGLNDGAHAAGVEIVGELELVPLAFAVFLLIQFFVLAKRYANALNNEEDLTANLELKVQKRTEELENSRNEIVKKGEALENAYQSITDSMKYASRIQRSLMGSQKSVQDAFDDAFLIFRPRDIVSGDFYWYAEVKTYHDQFGNPVEESRTLKIIIAADCTGHGVPGAFMTVIGHNALDEIIHEHGVHDPANILEELDKRVVNVFHDKVGEKRNEGMDISILVFSEQDQKVYFAGAKNPLWWTRKGDTEMRIIKGAKFPIGGLQHQHKKFETSIIDYQDFDKFYIFSDGYQDQFGGAENRKYMTKRFRKLLFEGSQLPKATQEQELLQELEAWKGDQPQTDDILVIGICAGCSA